jgi:hypothetical protein
MKSVTYITVWHEELIILYSNIHDKKLLVGYNISYIATDSLTGVLSLPETLNMVFSLIMELPVYTTLHNTKNHVLSLHKGQFTRSLKILCELKYYKYTMINVLMNKLCLQLSKEINEKKNLLILLTCIYIYTRYLEADKIWTMDWEGQSTCGYFKTLSCKNQEKILNLSLT